jgi:peptide/nickel transport system permease protein
MAETPVSMKSLGFSRRVTLSADPWIGRRASAIGAGTPRVLLFYILPALVAPLIVQGTHICASAILVESYLSFLGAGTPPHIPSWGNVINAGGKLIKEAPWISLFPAIAITITGLGLNMLGDALHDALDPRLRSLTRPR